MKTIAILHYTVPPVIGGIENTIYHHIRLYNQEGYDVRVIAGRGEDSYYEVAFHHQIDFYRVPEIHPLHPETASLQEELELERGPLSGHVQANFEKLRERLYQRLRQILEGCDVCLVHNILTSSANLALTAALHHIVAETGLPLAAWCHTIPGEEARGRQEYPWNLLHAAWPGVRYVTTSEQRRQDLAAILEIAPEAIAIIPPGIEASSFLKWEPQTMRLIRQANLLAADPLLLAPAAIRTSKDLGFAIQVVAALRARKPSAMLLITGLLPPPGDQERRYFHQLEVMVEKLGLQESVIFLQAYLEQASMAPPTEEMSSDLFRLADLLILPGLSHGFAHPVLGAGLERVPIFASSTPAIREITAGLAHYFDPQGDPQQVAEEILAFLEKDPSYRWRRQVLSHFTWDTVFKERLGPLTEALMGPSHEL